MIAATARRYGPPDVMALETLPDPVPGPGQVLIRVAAFGVTRGDARVRGLDVPRGMGLAVRAMFGWTRPRRIVPGREFAGTVAALGPGATGWAAGDPVFGLTDGMTMGAGAGLVAVRGDGHLFPRPPTLTEDQAAAFFFGGLTAADFLIDQMALKAGERLLILGATGAVGSAAVQIGVHLGARVTAVASAANHALARALGASTVQDYRDGLPDGPFDAILDTPGVLTWPQARNRLAPGGRLGMVTARALPQTGALLRPRRDGRRRCAGITRETRDRMERLIALHAAGGYTPVLGPVLPMAQIVQAHAIAGGGHKRGNLVVRP